MRHSKRKNFLPNDFDELLDYLAFPGSISDDDRAILQTLDINLKQYPPRTVILRHGEQRNQTLLIRSGWACTYVLLPDGGRQITDYHLRGDLVFHVDPARKGPYDSLQAISELSVFEIPSREFMDVLKSAPTLTACVFAAFARYKAISSEHLTSLGRRKASIRTAYLLLELGVRLAKVGLADEEGYDCPLTQNDLADALGLTPIHMSRTLRELRQADLVSLHNGRLTFLDREALKNFAQFSDSYIIGGED
jgi:CRP-like cAMP-binding protein